MVIRTFDPNDEELMLRLINCGDGSVDLAVVDTDGEPVAGGFLLNVSVDMGLTLYSGVDEDYGFPLDDANALSVEGIS